MSEPELWTRCPKATGEVVLADCWPVWTCACHGTDALINVPFDEATERMAAVAYEEERIVRLRRAWPPWEAAGPTTKQMWRKSVRPLLRAAVGEGEK